MIERSQRQIHYLDQQLQLPVTCARLYFRDFILSFLCQKPLHQFPRSKSATRLKKLSRAKVCVCCVVSFPKFHYNDLLPASRQLPRVRGSYGETCLMDLGHYTTNRNDVWCLLHSTDGVFIITLPTKNDIQFIIDHVDNIMIDAACDKKLSYCCDSRSYYYYGQTDRQTTG